MDVLKKRGYVIFRNVIGKNDIINAQNNVNKKTVNYTEIEKFNNIIFNKIYEKTNVRLKCSKYRVSNNNNSTDAGQFHKDLKLLDEKDINRNNAPPIYTVVTYLDSTQMELLPFSHKDYNMNLVDSLKSFNDTVTVKMNPGDILMFYSILIHRGVFTLKSENRRIIQNFVCIPQDKYEHYNSKLLHVRCDGTCDPTRGNIMKSISSSKLMNPIFNYLLYLNSSMGYSGSWNHINLLGCKDYKYVATEATNPRLVPKYNQFDTINRYIVNQPDLNVECNNISRALLFRGFYINYMIYLFVILLLILGTLYYVGKYMIKYKKLKRYLKKMKTLLR